MTNPSDISFIDNNVAQKAPSDYEVVIIDVPKALKSFQLSMFSYEVMHKDGSLKSEEDLSEKQQSLRQAIKTKMQTGEPFQRPVAGIGINDNFELGSGRDLFMTLAIEGWNEIPVHIRTKQKKELSKFIKDK